MDNIIERDLRRLDLNLLPVFHALMQERHVTRAAERLYLGQPAVSGALKRLRAAFGDPLFVRGRAGMEPTPRALELARQVDALLQGLHGALTANRPFEPQASSRVFRIGSSEAVGAALFPRLVRHLASEAPGVRLVTLDTDRHRVAAMLERNEIELALGMHDEGPGWLRQRPLFEWRFVCLYNAALIRPRRTKLDLREFLRHPHLLTSFKGELHGYIDEELAALGHARRVLFANPHFATNPFIVRDTAALVTVPDYIARIWSRDLGLAISPLPFPLPAHRVSATWKASMDGDAGLRWLVGTVAGLGAP
ncbi:LysR family transcriptional regulator [Frateuria sp. Soil773]|uniref:LysR family transcriptional regulator n=1 Tax=Frateuria sp. Soil773 TaxID=1736407 RepID=UPI0006F8078C|nr:LysR family transcriptional regulator [Frateuria sp. Soil773]KRE97856.1 LysR family transcriptional regulator [Frateuria sp. Soil773]